MADYICREAILDDLEKEIEAGNVALDEDVWINKGLRIARRHKKQADALHGKSGQKKTMIKCEFMRKQGTHRERNKE